MILFNVKEFLGEFTFGQFLERENRFVCRVLVKNKERKAHLSDTGRLRELLKKGAPVVLSPNPKGKLDYKVVSIGNEGEWIFLNPSLHSRIAERLIREGFIGTYPKSIRREVTVGKSRIDFLIDESFYLEVKGCNLVEEEVCLFPDAPTLRGKKHLLELIRLKEKGFRTGVLFLAFRECNCFSPNRRTDWEFCNTFKRALSSGVEFFGFKLGFCPESGNITVRDRLNICRGVL
jgi:sugar fermentation stimulation protein A